MRHVRAVVRGKLFSLIGAASVLVAGTAGAAELNALKGVTVEPTAAGAKVVIAGSRAPTFTVFRLSGPDRLVLDLSSADASGITGHHDGSGPVSGIVASQFSDAHSSVSRVLVALDHAGKYDVHAEGDSVVVAISKDAPGEAGSIPSPVASVLPAATSGSTPANKGSIPSNVDGAHSGAVTEDGVTIAEADQRKVSHPAHALTSVVLGRDGLTLGADGELARYELLALTNPNRLALDVYGVDLKARSPKNHTSLVKEVRAGAHSDKVRLVLDLEGALPSHKVSFTRHGLSLALTRAAPSAVAKAEKAAPVSEEPMIEIDGKRISPETAPLAVKDAPAVAQAATVEVEDLKFNESAKGGAVAVKLSGETAWKVERPDSQSAVLTLSAAHLPKRLERSLDTSALDTPVKMVSAFSVPGKGDQVRIVVSADRAIDARIAKAGDRLTFQLAAETGKPEQVTVNEKTAGMATDVVAATAESQMRRSRYTGKRVTFEFKDIDIQNLLRVIAEVSKKNIVVADDVKGTVTIRLRNVPWDQALELILRSKGLGQENIGNILRVAPLKTLEEEAKSREERRKSMVAAEPLTVQLIPVNYASAGDMMARVKDVLTERGNVTVDTRTNVLIVRDIASNIQRARSLVQALDTQTPEVLIESRIVEANTNFSRQIGVQWGGYGQLANGTGNGTGLGFPDPFRVGGGVAAGTAPTTGISDNPNFAVNLPAAVGAGSGGALGFIFGSAGGAAQLNLRLSALENQGEVKTISAPRVTTLDNITAKISQGVQIPYSQVSAAGVNTTFVQAQLSLEVTPHITQNGSVMMNIHATNDQPDPANTGANGQPAIQKKEAQTQVLVADGDTTVIGGIYVRTASHSTSMVPFLGRIPILGFFFRNDTNAEARQELLIFVTPHIVNRQTIPQHL